MNSKYSFKHVVLPKEGFLRGPFGGDLKKEIFVQKGAETYKVYEQGVVLNSDKNIGRYYISEEDYKAKLHKFSIRDKDFLVSCSGVNMGAIYQIREPFERGIINQALLRIRLNNELIDDNYFFYLFKELISKKIRSGSGDSTIPNFPGLDLIKNIEFELPSKKTQFKVGKILKDIDSKIELNNRINAELEAMAKTLYDYWFVQFDFPNEQGKPYKTSGGKMVWDEQLKREIPNGWKVNCLGDLGNFKNGVNYDPSNPGNIACPIINVRNISASSIFLKNEDLDIIYLNGSDVRKYSVHNGSIIIARSGIPGATRLVSDCAANTLYCGFAIHFELNDLDKKIPIFYFLKSIELQLQNGSGGTILKNVNQGTLNALKIALPLDNNIQIKFNKLIEPIFGKINLIQKENQHLNSLLDWLLPMLMNGQVKVGTKEKAVYKAKEELGMAAEPGGEIA